MKYGYTSAKKNETIRAHVASLQRAGCQKIYFGGKGSQIEELLGHLKLKDFLVVVNLTFLASSFKEIVIISEVVKKRGAHLQILEGDINTSLFQKNIVFNVFQAVANFKGVSRGENVKRGMERAKNRGVKLGRPHGASAKTFKKALKVTEVYQEGEKSAAEIAREFSISRETLYNYLKRCHCILRNP